MAEQIADALDRPLHYELVEHVSNRPNPDMRYSISSTRLEKLGWRPLVDFEDGIKATVGYYVGQNGPMAPNLLESTPENDTRSPEHGRTG